VKEFFDMGGYAAFVWPAYLVTFGVIGLNVFWAYRVLARARRAARRRLDARGEPA
jgi:heme exporter protein CcmD